MKKLMTAVAIVCATVYANAATVAWGSGKITDHSGAALTAASQVTAYLFTIDSTAYTSYSAMSAADLSTGLWDAYGEKLGTATASQANTYSKKAGGVAKISAIDAVADTPVYVALLYVDTRESDTYFMGNVATINWSGVGDPSVDGLANYLTGVASAGATAWATASVPEPTSGLLFLLGMAGLALRRRRA